MEWIKCSERKPERGKDILAYAKDSYDGEWKVIKAAYYDKYSIKGRKPDLQFHEECNCSGYERDPMLIGEVKFWMPLPPIPGEKTDKILHSEFGSSFPELPKEDE